HSSMTRTASFENKSLQGLGSAVGIVIAIIDVKRKSKATSSQTAYNASPLHSSRRLCSSGDANNGRVPRWQANTGPESIRQPQRVSVQRVRTDFRKQIQGWRLPNPGVPSGRHIETAGVVRET